MGTLKKTTERSACDSLLPAIRAQAEKFSDYYDIATEVVADCDVAVNGLLFEEIMQIVREALSNIRRRTRARQGLS